MKTLRLSLLLLLLAGSFWSCTDHRNSPLAPQRLRLKATDNNIAQTGVFADYQGRTEYTYDQMGRQATVLRPGFSRAVFTYDDQNRVTGYVNRSETSTETHRVEFLYTAGANGIRTRTYFGTNIDPSERGEIALDATGRVVSTFTGDGVTLNTAGYQYTGDNITSILARGLRTEFTYGFQFDNKPNPFFGLITPDFRYELSRIYYDDVIQRSNRNNVIQYSEAFFSSVLSTTELEYDYNAQGLPTKMRVKGQPGELVFTYEAY